MNGRTKFRNDLVEAASAVMNCQYCRSHAPKGDHPQPGWVGNLYKPGKGVVVILQNPGAEPKNYSDVRERRMQRLLREFKQTPSIETHNDLMQFVFADMAGEAGGPPWAKWTHPVSKLIPNREQLAWMNVVKHRTPGSIRKDDPVSLEAAHHGITEHLQCELKKLKPIAVVALGNEARSALSKLSLPPGITTHHLKLQGASNKDAKMLRKRLLDAGADI